MSRMRAIQSTYDEFSVEVRGNGNPLPALAALCRPHGWLAIDCASNQPLDLTEKAAAG